MNITYLTMTETQKDKQSDREKNAMTKAKPVGVRDNNENNY